MSSSPERSSKSDPEGGKVSVHGTGEITDGSSAVATTTTMDAETIAAPAAAATSVPTRSLHDEVFPPTPLWATDEPNPPSVEGGIGSSEGGDGAKGAEGGASGAGAEEGRAATRSPRDDVLPSTPLLSTDELDAPSAARGDIGDDEVSEGGTGGEGGPRAEGPTGAEEGEAEGELDGNKQGSGKDKTNAAPTVADVAATTPTQSPRMEKTNQPAASPPPFSSSSAGAGANVEADATVPTRSPIIEVLPQTPSLSTDKLDLPSVSGGVDSADGVAGAEEGEAETQHHCRSQGSTKEKTNEAYASPPSSSSSADIEANAARTEIASAAPIQSSLVEVFPPTPPLSTDEMESLPGVRTDVGITKGVAVAEEGEAKAQENCDKQGNSKENTNRAVACSSSSSSSSPGKKDAKKWALRRPSRDKKGAAANTKKKRNATATAAAAAGVGLMQMSPTTGNSTAEANALISPMPAVAGAAAVNTEIAGGTSTKPMPRPEVVGSRAPTRSSSQLSSSAHPTRGSELSHDSDSFILSEDVTNQEQQQSGASHVVQLDRHRSPSVEPQVSRAEFPRRTLNNDGTVRVLEATLVDHDEAWDDEAPLAVATKADDSCTFNFRNRHVQVMLALVAAIIVALAVGLGVTLSNNSGGDSVSKGSTGQSVLGGAPEQKDEEPRLPTQTDAPSTTLPPSSANVNLTNTTPASDLPSTTIVPSFSLTRPTLKEPSKLGLCQAETLFPINGSPGDYFSKSVAVSGDTVVLGAEWDDENGTNSGSVIVQIRTISGWAPQAKLLPSDGEAGDTFGISLAIDGDTIVVGAPFKNGNRGAIYIFVRNGAGWSEQAKVVPNNRSVGAYFGFSVAISKQRIIVGAPEGLLWDESGQGKAYIFVRVGQTWVEQSVLAYVGTSDDALFGWSVALDEDTALVGVPRDDEKGTYSGSVCVYVFLGIEWMVQTKLLAQDGLPYEEFGGSLSLHSGVALIGVRYDNTPRGDHSGSAYIFTSVDSTWAQEAKLLPIDGAAYDYFGYSVALVSHEAALVGAWGDDDNGDLSGSAYLFVRLANSTWTQQSKLVPKEGQGSDEFGWSVAADNGTAVVGTWDAEKAYLYEEC